MRTLLFGIVGCLSLMTPCLAQEVFHFDQGLIAATGHSYGREAWYRDELAWGLYHHTLETPAAGAVWHAVTADSLHRFRNQGAPRTGSYLYLTYTSDREKSAILNVSGDAGCFVNGVPHAGDPYGSGWLLLPIRLRKGVNEIYVRVAGSVTARLTFPAQEISLSVDDPTLPVPVAGASGNDSLLGAVVVINTTNQPLAHCDIVATSGGKTYRTPVPEVPPLSTRKVPFLFSAGEGHFTCALQLVKAARTLDEKSISLETVQPGASYAVTFLSDIDGSLQYYAITPQAPVATADGAPGNGARPALFLSPHGAGVEAIGQARAYRPKDWGVLVAPTNRRPRGFNWEDWGRLDALEVLSLAEKRFNPDPLKIYLSGHSMGGHGTWFLGATYPDHWAAIAPCSGYPTLKDYGSHDGVVPDSARSPIERMLLRASDQSDVLKLVSNYKPVGIYILHGDADDNVPVRYARQMRAILGQFHPDFSYHEVPGAGHWYGNQSEDWPPLFDFFKWHFRKPDSLVNTVDFMTSGPGISDAYYWASIRQQDHPLAYSRIELTRSLRTGAIEGTTDNVRMLRFSLADFAQGTTVHIRLDGSSPLDHVVSGAGDSVYLLHTGAAWQVTGAPDPWQKSPARYGTFKDAFRNRMVFVYSTSGSAAENQWSLDKARYDAETWYYRGNGAVDLVSDKAYAQGGYEDRSVILYGNANTNSAWKLLLADCPIHVERGRITMGDRTWTGDSLATYFVWPLRFSPVAAVSVIAGTGPQGMDAANANQYFAGASGFPDYMIFSLEMVRSGSAGVEAAGFFDNDWKLSPVGPDAALAQGAQ